MRQVWHFLTKRPFLSLTLWHERVTLDFPANATNDKAAKSTKITSNLLDICFFLTSERAT
jgi:hypothetical protein